MSIYEDELQRMKDVIKKREADALKENKQLAKKRAKCEEERK